MKKLFPLLFCFALFFNLSAQVVSEGFEINCPSTSNPFLSTNGCYPDWIVAHGTPDTDSNFGFPAHEGNQYLHCHVRTTDCNSMGINNPNFSHGDGIALRYDFEAGQAYTIRYFVRYGSGTGNWSPNWVLANDLVEMTGFSPNCSPGGDVVPPLPPIHQIIPIGNWADPSDWMEQGETFTAEEDFDFLWLRIKNISPFNTDYVDDFYLDAFELEPCIGGVIPDFYTADKEGKEEDSFCYGEDIYVCFDPVPGASWNETVFRIYELPTNALYTQSGVRFDVDPSGGCYNLSQFIRDNGGNPLSGDVDYRIEMTIDNAACGPLSISESITVNCCEIDADFWTRADGTFLPYQIGAQAITDYTPYGGSHTFCLYTDFNQDGDLELVTCSSGPFFSYPWGFDNITYYLIHRVETSCGDYCTMQTICRGSECPAFNTPSAPVSCGFVAGETCAAPRADCPTQTFTTYELTWETVLDADEYEILINPTGANCNCQSNQLQAVRSSDRNSLTISSGPIGNCFSYQVTPICDGQPGSPSEIVCFPDCAVPTPGLMASGREEKIETLSPPTKLMASPNPFDQGIRIEAGQLPSSPVRVVIIDLLGKVHLNQTLQPVGGKLIYEWLPNATVPSGTYLINLIHEEGRETIKVLKF